MTISKNIKVWVIINSVILSIVLVFFILGLLYSEYWVEIIDFADILMLPIFLLIFYQGFYIGGFVSIITLGIFIKQICNLKKSGIPIPAIWIIGEAYVILLGILDVIPIISGIIGNLYYIIPGW